MSHALFTCWAGMAHPGSEQGRAAGIGAMGDQAERVFGSMSTTLHTLSSRAFTWRSVEECSRPHFQSTSWTLLVDFVGASALPCRCGPRDATVSLTRTHTSHIKPVPSWSQTSGAINQQPGTGQRLAHDQLRHCIERGASPRPGRRGHEREAVWRLTPYTNPPETALGTGWRTGGRGRIDGTHKRRARG
jgi:hypothetical protein